VIPAHSTTIRYNDVHAIHLYHTISRQYTMTIDTALQSVSQPAS